MTAKKLDEHSEFEFFFGDSRILVESFGEEKLILGFFSTIGSLPDVQTIQQLDHYLMFKLYNYWIIP